MGYVLTCRTTSFAANKCIALGSGKDEASIDAAEAASGRPSRASQLRLAMRPRSCDFSVSVNGKLSGVLFQYLAGHGNRLESGVDELIHVQLKAEVFSLLQPSARVV